MLKFIFKIFLIMYLDISHIDSAKILAIYPIPCISHQLYYRTLTIELLKRGHELTVLTTDPAFSNDTAPNNIREISFYDISYKVKGNFLEMPIGKPNYHIIQMHISYEALSILFEKQLKTDTVKNILNNKEETFDLLLYDGCMLAPIIFSHIYKIPAIAINSLGGIYGQYGTMGAVVNEAFYPSNLRSKSAKNQIERLQEVFKYYYNQFHIQWYIENVQNKAVQNALGTHMPDIRELRKNINMMFINLYSAWDSHRPVPISLQHMGGLHSIPGKPLPEDIKSYLDSSVKGVIYMSLGTTVNSSRLLQKKINIFAKVFSQLPYNILWKWDSVKILGELKNVRLFEWLPQSDVLKHPNVKLFITQGGLQSTEEAITAGVPLIGIPLLADQWFNTEKYMQYNIGLQLELEALTEKSLRNAIDRVLGNQSYRSNIIQHRSLMHDRLQKALYKSVHWIEYVIKHGASHLQAPAADIPWVVYVELELLITMIVIIGSVIAGLYFFLNFVVGKFCFMFWHKDKSKNNW